MASTIIPVYLAQLLDKLKKLSPQTTDNILSKQEGEAAGAQLSASTTPKLDYPAAPQRTVLPDTTKFEATPNRSSVALATAGLIAQKNANLEAANEENAQKAWFEKMKDTSDIYKTDRAIDRQTAADEARMDRLAEMERAKSELEKQRQEGRSNLQSQKIEAQNAQIELKNSLKQSLINATKNLKPSAYQDYKDAFNNYITDNAVDPSNPLPAEIEEAMKVANMTIGKAPKSENITKYSGVKENAEAKQAREDADNANAAKIMMAMNADKITTNAIGSFKKDGKKTTAQQVYSDMMKTTKIPPADFNRAWKLINK